MTDAPPPAPAPYSAAPAAKPTNTLAIIALIGAFVLAPVGIICGHIALGQIKKTGEGGQPLALWGMILGYVFTALWLLIMIFAVVVPLIFLSSSTAFLSNIPNY
ncbi:MAG: DUF4190 domain-containing protein [Cryobacterium sp.]|nr:DUF4190 domain-containing protein [Cryobacterium sp.]MBX3117081.1 DUF4190 domain-containing protein [Cryobacterium sp.]MCC7128106.1 DUF4190 domain-containing protein [Microbacteriaceae bacterium]